MKKWVIFALILLVSCSFTGNQVVDVSNVPKENSDCPINVKETSCNCGNGNSLSFTVFFRGFGELNEAERNFRNFLGERENSVSSTCCTSIVLPDFDYSYTKDIRENAKSIAYNINNVNTIITTGRDDITSINLHLIGFSTGGLVAIETANLINQELPAPNRESCGKKLPDSIPVKIDLVTIATPYEGDFGGGMFPKIGEKFCKTLGIGGVLGCSVGSKDYGGKTAPKNLCSFTALVTDKTSDDTAGGHLPDIEKIGEDWHPVVEHLENVGHNDAVLKALETRPELFNLGCECNQQR
ncbi:hypothetical protein HZA97_03680 [Candidatus Woesearchaeota archaeon]|nr:hypothetical protein [Candidatus Woesearchaeota archaeon]